MHHKHPECAYYHPSKSRERPQTMMEAAFFVLGAIFGAIFTHAPSKEEFKAPFMPQRIKPPAYVPQWDKEEGEVVMPERDVTSRDLKIDDLLQ